MNFLESELQIHKKFVNWCKFNSRTHIQRLQMDARNIMKIGILHAVDYKM